MKVYTNNEVREFGEMNTIWGWMTDNFGPPENHSGTPKARWTYGKDTPDFVGSNIINGTWEIEWFDFVYDKDAMLFTLRWL